MYAALSEDEIKYIVETLKKVLWMNKLLIKFLM
jgi:hypothetical protein